MSLRLPDRYLNFPPRQDIEAADKMCWASGLGKSLAAKMRAKRPEIG